LKLRERERESEREREEKMKKGYFRSKTDPKPPLNEEIGRENLEREKLGYACWRGRARCIVLCNNISHFSISYQIVRSHSSKKKKDSYESSLVIFC